MDGPDRMCLDDGVVPIQARYEDPDAARLLQFRVSASVERQAVEQLGGMLGRAAARRGGRALDDGQQGGNAAGLAQALLVAHILANDRLPDNKDSPSRP